MIDQQEEMRLRAELGFMYRKYEELCKAYKKLAQEAGSPDINAVHDMSHMSFEEYKG
jgi:hypothetical protein